MRKVFRLFGLAVASVDYEGFEDDEERRVEDEDLGPSFGGGSSHNFEIDHNPRYPEADKDYDTWIEKPFGFQPKKGAL